MRKLIKKILNLIGWTSLTLVLLSIVLSVIINTPRLQNYITEKAFGKLEELFGNNISFTNVKLHLFNKAEFENLLIRDMQNDTLVYAPRMKAALPGILRKVLINPEIPVRLSRLHFEDSYFRLYTDSTLNINLNFIVDTLKARKKPDKVPEPFYINKITIENSRLELHRFDTVTKDFGIDFSEMTFTDFNLKVTNL